MLEVWWRTACGNALILSLTISLCFSIELIWTWFFVKNMVKLEHAVNSVAQKAIQVILCLRVLATLKSKNTSKFSILHVSFNINWNKENPSNSPSGWQENPSKFLIIFRCLSMKFYFLKKIIRLKQNNQRRNKEYIMSEINSTKGNTWIFYYF